MRKFLAIPCLVILPLLLAGCGGEQQISCGDLEKRMTETSKTLQVDVLMVAKAKMTGDAKAVCATSSSILSNVRPLFKAASDCKSVSPAISLNQLIRTLEGMRQESKCA
jgi:uncharacterized protein YcfL